jgi:hypothetical protein
MQSNYWNSSLNGGLPIVRKRDPIHEGTYLLHDICHFAFLDPVYDARDEDRSRAAYILFRMASEASTMVLADMIAMAAARVQEIAYDPSLRRIYPLYESLRTQRNTVKQISELLEANIRYAILGDDSGFRKLGACEVALTSFRNKYERFFSADMRWNHSNFIFMQQNVARHPTLRTYYRNLPNLTGHPGISEFAAKLFRNKKADIEFLIDHFCRQATEAILYPRRYDPFLHQKRAAVNFYAGQGILFASHHDVPSSSDAQRRFERSLDRIKTARTAKDIDRRWSEIDSIFSDFLWELRLGGRLLPHEVPVFLTHVPHFPPRYVNYDSAIKPQKLIRNTCRELLTGYV